MTSVVLKAEKRENLGSLVAKKIRKAGKIPAVIYSKDGNINLSVDTKEFEHEYFKGTALTSVVELDLDGKKIKVIAHKVELDPVSDRPVHIDFFNCQESKTIRAQAKLVFTNQDKSPGLKRGGFLHVVLRKVDLICENEKSIPSQIQIDLGSAPVGIKIRGFDLQLPAGVKLAKKDSFLIASIIGRASKEDEAATPAAGAAAPAAGAAATPAAAEKKADKK